MGVSIDAGLCRSLPSQYVIVLLKDSIDLVLLIVDAVSSQKDHIADRLHDAMAMTRVLYIRVPVDFVLARIGRNHLPKSSADTRPQVRVESRSCAGLVWDLLHLEQSVLRLAAELLINLMKNVRTSSLPETHSTLLSVCHGVQDGSHLLGNDFVHQGVRRMWTFKELSTSGQNFVVKDSHDTVRVCE